MDRLFWHGGLHLPFWQSIVCFVVGCILSLFFFNTLVFFSTIILVVLVIVAITTKNTAKFYSIITLLVGASYPILYYHCVYSSNLSYDELQQKQVLHGVIEQIDNYQFNDRLIVKTTKIAHTNLKPYALMRAQVYISRAINTQYSPKVGDTISIRAKFKPIKPRLNEGLFDRRLHNFYVGLKYKGSVSKTDDFAVLTRATPSHITNLGSLSHFSWLYRGVLFGDTSAMPANIKSTVRNLGIAHLFAVSGLHMAIVFGFSFWLGKLALLLVSKFASHNTLRITPYFIAIAACATYLHAADYATSAIRAFIMIVLLCLCLLVNRSYTSKRALLCALLLVLLVNPFVLLSSGFYFSFIAVASILVALDLANKRRITRPLYQLAFIQLVISITLAPLTVLFFNGTSVLSVFVNLLAIPLFSFFVMPLMLCVVLVDYVFSFSTPCRWLDALLKLLIKYIERIGEHITWHYVPPISWQLIMLTIAAVLLLLYYYRSALLTLPILVFYYANALNKEPNLTIRILDVGHGLSVIISKQGEAVLYDLGARYQDFSYFNHLVLPTLAINRLNLIKTVISHDDNDHSGGLTDLRHAGYFSTISGFEKACNINANWLENVRFKSFAAPHTAHSDNNSSCVLLITSGKFKLLLTGDIEAERENMLLSEPSIQNIDVLISPHHGSNSSSTEGFINKTQPRWVVHSVNAYNRWRLPSLTVVTRYAEYGTKQLATSRGAVKIVVTSNGYTLSYAKQQNYWFLVD
ncbi:DNA internalization-related competence protein ComEC/Rec2 [Pseudoalteromonas spongiae]|uniref:DNA internalization-related competence protein ComEC/Rec2 n=1 Tax=Pseudoalteromonas spongiae TaxID=298657 RepID=UPI000C2CE6D7|nr:DNA internalization-related competence protein ComEC/Rec2 [Pseudoalteromonas spongiae]